MRGASQEGHGASSQEAESCQRWRQDARANWSTQHIDGQAQYSTGDRTRNVLSLRHYLRRASHGRLAWTTGSEKRTSMRLWLACAIVE